MQILVAASTELEIAPFKTRFPSADILITGVGAPAAIYHLTKRIKSIDYDLVIQAGIAGAFNTDMPLGDVVTVREDTFGDVGIMTTTDFDSVFDVGLADADHAPYTNGWLINPENFSLPYKQLRGVTVNTITDDRRIIEIMSAKFQFDIETMEGAAVHYVCLQENVPFLQLRTLSNFIGERDKGKWKLELAVKNLNQALQEIYEHITMESIHNKPAQ